MKKLLLITSLLLMSACSPPTITKTICPDGMECAAIDCVGSNYTHADCVVAFGNACPHGYDMVDNKDGAYLIRCHDKKW